MKKNALGAFLALCFGSATGLLVGQSVATPVLSLVDVSTEFTPGAEVILPVEVSGIDQGLSSLKFGVEYPQALLEFVEVRPASSEGELTVETVHLDSVGEVGTGRLEIQANSPQGVANNPLLEIVFKPSQDIFENEELVVKITEASLQAVGGEETAQLETKDANVRITIPMFACFFYMH